MHDAELLCSSEQDRGHSHAELRARDTGFTQGEQVTEITLHRSQEGLGPPGLEISIREVKSRDTDTDNAGSPSIGKSNSL